MYYTHSETATICCFHHQSCFARWGCAAVTGVGGCRWILIGATEIQGQWNQTAQYWNSAEVFFHCSRIIRKVIVKTRNELTKKDTGILTPASVRFGLKLNWAYASNFIGEAESHDSIEEIFGSIEFRQRDSLPEKLDRIMQFRPVALSWRDHRRKAHWRRWWSRGMYQ